MLKGVPIVFLRTFTFKMNKHVRTKVTIGAKYNQQYLNHGVSRKPTILLISS